MFHHGLAGVVEGEEAGYCSILTLVRLFDSLVWHSDKPAGEAGTAWNSY